MAYIELKNVTYHYPLAKEASLRNCSLEIEKGKFYALLGENGGGKTTLCNVIRGFIPSFFQGELEGEVLFQGKKLSEYTQGELAPKMGYVFQNPFNQITGARDNVYEEIAYGLEKLGVPKEEIIRRVDAVMELTNTAAFGDKNPFELSGGQQQRVALASIIVLEPDVLVIDEPTSQLDPKETERVFDIIKKMKDMGKTIILAEHKIELIAEYADQVIVMEKGEIIRSGDKYQVLSEISLLDHGVDLPQAVLLAHELRKKGMNIRPGIIKKEELALEIEKNLKTRGGKTYGNN